jgi:Protein of unknown function (DUF1681)
LQVIDPTVDSSRYFVLRVQNPQTRVLVSIGIGFADRDVAGSFKLAASEHARYLKRMRDAKHEAALHQAAEGQARLASKDFSLTGSIRVQLPRVARTAGAGLQANQQRISPVQASFLPPPAPASSRKQANDAEDDEFGEFVA